MLTERIIRYISQPGHDINQLLVVTFTEAAAGEMLERIGQKLSERISLDPANTHLSRQLLKLPAARISTIHAFCKRLICDNFQLVDLDPSFRVGSETEMALLKTMAMDELLDEEYEKEVNDSFLDLADAFGGKAKDDQLDALVRKIDTFLENCPYPEEAAMSYIEIYNVTNNIENTPWVKIIKNELHNGLNSALEAVKIAIYLCKRPRGPEKYLETLHNDEKLVKKLLAALDNPYESIYGIFTECVAPGAFSRIHAYRANDDISETLKDSIKMLRDKAIKKQINDLISIFFFTHPQKMLEDVKNLYNRVMSIFMLTLKYRKKYAEMKHRHNLLDFSDLEHFAIKIVKPYGVEGECKNNHLNGLFNEVLIDEYQDSNMVQETILANLSGSRFMVGDVKQSIYRFRRAAPGLFIEKYNNYDTWGPETVPTLYERVDLSKNFRSRREVIDTVNFFFMQLMSPEMGNVEYNKSAALKANDKYPTAPEAVYNTIVDIVLMDEDTENEAIDDDWPFDNIITEMAQIELEAALIARRIKIILNEKHIWDEETKEYRRCQLGDIVILTRGASKIAPALSESLIRHGIDAITDASASLFETIEIKTVMALLRVVDNPRQDIELLAVLFSPIYGFTPDELLLIREIDKEADFYECLETFEEIGEGAVGVSGNLADFALDKSRRFIQDLTRWRSHAAWLPVSRLINIILEETKYSAYCNGQPGGGVKLANLRLLTERAIEYEATSLKGLFNFVRFIENTQKAGGVGGIPQAQAIEGHENSVRIMTVHKSKGLEFPIVFVSMLGRMFNREDERQKAVLSQNYGIGINYINLKTRVESRTLAKVALSRQIRNENISEEMRVLYVAMTRAKEMLVLTGAVKNWDKKRTGWIINSLQQGLPLPIRALKEPSSYLDWIMPCLARHPSCQDIMYKNLDLPKYKGDEITGHPAHFDVNLVYANDMALTNISPTITPAHDKLMDGELIKTWEIEPYPYANLLDIPSKISISELKRYFALEISPDSDPVYESKYPIYEPPDFLKEKIGANAMRMGTVLHTVIEHLDLEICRAKDDIIGLLSTLIAKNLINAEESKALNVNSILSYVNSPLADRMRASGKLYREVPFVMAIPPHEVNVIKQNTQEDNDSFSNNAAAGLDMSSVLIHGIIDCYFEENGKIVIIDFKNDSIIGDPNEWAKKYRVQMGIYKRAAEQATGKEVAETLLYAFRHNAVYTLP